MSTKTKIVVLHMKEMIYTLVFAGLGILLILLLIFMFLPRQKDASSETMKYVAGVYTSTIQLNDNTMDVQVAVDEDRINSVSLVNLDETVAGGGKPCRADYYETVDGEYYIQRGESVYVDGDFECGE